MFAWEAIDKALDSIEDDLFETISTQQLAEHVGLSVFYFQRLFKRMTGRSVLEYVKLRRLAYSVALLEDVHKSILDIALECGFSSHANYTRAFHACFGLSPQTYRNERPALNMQLRPDVSLRYGSDALKLVVADNLILEISIRSICQPEFYLGLEINVPVAGQIPAGIATGIDLPGELWRRFHEYKERSSRLMGESVELGVCHSNTGDSFSYFAGIQVENAAEEDENLVGFTLVSGEYAVCRIEAPTHDELVTRSLYSATQYMYEVYLPLVERKPASFAVEKYNLPNSDALCMELWIPLVPLATAT